MMRWLRWRARMFGGAYMPHRVGQPLSCYGPLVSERFEWPDAPTAEFVEFIEQRRAEHDRAGQFSGSRALQPGDVPQAFQAHVADIMQRLDYGPIREYRYWYGVTLPNQTNVDEPRFAHGFPHAHGWEGLTLIHYVQTADEGGDLVQIDEQHHDINRFSPNPGTSIVVDGYSLHGVETITGTIPRYTLICTAFHAEQHKPGYRDAAGNPVRTP